VRADVPLALGQRFEAPGSYRRRPAPVQRVDPAADQFRLGHPELAGAALQGLLLSSLDVDLLADHPSHGW